MLSTPELRVQPPVAAAPNRLVTQNEKRTQLSLKPFTGAALGDHFQLRFGSLDTGTEATIQCRLKEGRLLEAAEAVSSLQDESKILRWLVYFNQESIDPMISAAAARAVKWMTTPDVILKAVDIMIRPRRGSMTSGPYNAIEAALYQVKDDRLIPREGLFENVRFRERLDSRILHMCLQLEGAKNPASRDEREHRTMVYAGLRAIELGALANVKSREAILDRLAQNPIPAIARKAADVRETLKDGQLRLSMPPEYYLE